MAGGAMLRVDKEGSPGGCSRSGGSGLSTERQAVKTDGLSQCVLGAHLGRHDDQIRHWQRAKHEQRRVKPVFARRSQRHQ